MYYNIIAACYSLVMCNNDFTTVLIIMIFVSLYDSYHDSKSNGKIQNLVLISSIPKCDLVIVQWIIHTVRTIQCANETWPNTLSGQNKIYE